MIKYKINLIFKKEAVSLNEIIEKTLKIELARLFDCYNKIPHNSINYQFKGSNK